MPIRFRCTKCQKMLLVKDEHAGKLGTCPSCRGTFEVPTQSMPASEPIPMAKAVNRAGAAAPAPASAPAPAAEPAAPAAGNRRPAPVPRPGHPAVTGSDTNLNLAGLQILVVDDDRFAQHLIGTTLKEHGATVLVAGDADTAVNAALLSNLDLILLDLGLPGGGGLTVLDRLAASDKLLMTPVIVISASDPATHRQKAIAAGAQSFLQKPVLRQALFDAIRLALR